MGHVYARDSNSAGIGGALLIHNVNILNYSRRDDSGVCIIFNSEAGRN